jgi:hypothetical protein
MIAPVISLRRVVRVVVPLAVALAVSGCGRRAVDRPDAFSWRESLPPGSSLHIRNGFGQITVVPAKDSMVHVIGGKHWRRGRERDVQFHVTHRGDAGEYYVCAMWRGSGRCGPTGYRGKRTDTFLSHFSLFHRNTDATASFVVEVPSGVLVDAKTTTGMVNIRGVHGGLNARSVVGSITAVDVGGGPVTLATTTGSIRLSVDSLGAADTIQATTVNGAVMASLPPNIEGNFDVATMSGRLRTDFPLETSQHRRLTTAAGRIGDGARLIKLRATRGSVAVLKTGSSDSGYISPERLP